MQNRRKFLRMTALGAAAFEGPEAMGQVGRPAPKASNKKIRLAVVGGGFGSTFHFNEHPQCVVAAATDLYAVRRQRLRDAYRCDSIYESMEDMLKKRNDIDAVAVFSGAPDHARHVEMCFRRGLHVLCAVPACMTLEEAQRLKELKEKTSLKYMMAESSYYRGGCIYARNLYSQGGFGKLFYSEVEYYHDGDIEALLSNKESLYYHPDGSNSWRQGIPPMLYPTHSLGYVTGVTGERIVSVSALGWGMPSLMATLKLNQYKNPFSNEFAAMQTDKGNMVRCNVFWMIAAGEERAQWFGEKGSFYMSKAGFHPDTWHERYGKPKPIRLPDYRKSDMLPEAMRHDSGHGGSAIFISAEFINALLEDREPEIDIYQSLAMTVPGIVAHQSALRNGEQMKVPQFDD